MKVFVDRIGARGDGIAVTEGGPIYIPDALPGEWVRIGNIKHRRGVARAEVRELLEASPARVTPGCFHYNNCGGCVAQHLGKKLYAAWKQEHVERVLLGAGLKAHVLPVLFVPIGSRRRVRMEFRVVGDETLLGFREAGSAWIVDVNDCIVATAGIVGVLPILRQFLPRFGGEGWVSVTELSNGLDVVVSSRDQPDMNLRMDAAAFCAEAGVSRLSWANRQGQTEPILIIDQPIVWFADASVAPPPLCFLQPTTQGETELRNFVLEAMGGSEKVVDLYAGCGAFALPLAAEGKSIHAVEAVVAQAEAINSSAGKRSTTIEVRDLWRQPLQAVELDRFDAVIIDPPRAGAAPQINQLAVSSVQSIVYVSCNPVTFARDALLLLNGGYKIGPVQPVDQFVWSHHIELVARFTLIRGN